jgi:hypothetical protein
MKRLAKRFYLFDKVRFTKNPFDDSIYTITQTFSDNTYFIDNGKVSYTNIKASSLEYADDEE